MGRPLTTQPRPHGLLSWDAIGDSPQCPRPREGVPGRSCVPPGHKLQPGWAQVGGLSPFPFPGEEFQSGKSLSQDSLAVAHVCANSLA